VSCTVTIIPSVDQTFRGYWVETALLPSVPIKNKPLPAPQPAKPTIPEDVLLKLESLRPILLTNGVLEYRKNEADRRDHWRLRYYQVNPNGRKRRSIRIGTNDHVACAVDLWLERIRRENRLRKMQEEQAHRDQRHERRLQRLYLQMATPGGRKMRRWVWSEYNRLKYDPFRRLELVMMVPHLKPAKRGRPVKGMREDPLVYAETVTNDQIRESLPASY